MSEHDFPTNREMAQCEFREYALVFNNDGTFESKQAADDFVNDAASGDFTDVVLICHGWNTTWSEARELYESFQRHFYESYGAEIQGRRLLWAGFHWHSIPDNWDYGAPQILSEPSDDVISEIIGKMELHAEQWELPAYDIDPDRLRTHLKSCLQSAADDANGDDDEEDEDALRAVDDSISKIDVEYGVAGNTKKLGRNLRVARTVWPMKNRAGDIGRGDAATLVQRLNEAAPKIPIRGIGHSFGGHLHLACLTKLAAAGSGRGYRSLLLLQPAVSASCFAENVLSDGTDGGFRPALAMVEQPIVSTYSRHDDVLRVEYPNGMNYREYLAEIQPKILAAPKVAGEIIPMHAALGGHGPRKSEDFADRQVLKLRPERLDWSESDDLIAVDGSQYISDHGDVDNVATAWLLSQQIQRS